MITILCSGDVVYNYNFIVKWSARMSLEYCNGNSKEEQLEIVGNVASVI
jgi:hypothetical protein